MDSLVSIVTDFFIFPVLLVCTVTDIFAHCCWSLIKGMVFFNESQHLVVDICHCGSCESCLKRYSESAIRDFHVASVQIWMLHLSTNTEFFTWYHVDNLQSVKWLAVGWILSMQFLLEAVIFLVRSGLTFLQPTKPPVELILWRLFTGKKCLILHRLFAFV